MASSSCTKSNRPEEKRTGTSLVNRSVSALPPILKAIHLDSDDKVMDVVVSATQYSNVFTSGRIGSKPSSLTVQHRDGNILRVDCLNNPESWFEINLTHLKMSKGSICRYSATQKVRLTQIGFLEKNDQIICFDPDKMMPRISYYLWYHLIRVLVSGVRGW